jgi:hypothetical protein
MTELVDFLSKVDSRGKLENTDHVDRGRYGYAHFLKVYGPAFIRGMPHGYVVELVQLLLNKGFLQFRKGLVSFR